MELFLNILWVVIAVAALGIWRYIWKCQERCRAHKPWQEWTAFACVLIFLFFAVSLSDDLHAAVILSDDCSRGRHHSLSWNCSCSPHAEDGPVFVSVPVRPTPALSNPLQECERVTPVVFVLDATDDPLQIALRGPPSDSL